MRSRLSLVSFLLSAAAVAFSIWLLTLCGGTTIGVAIGLFFFALCGSAILLLVAFALGTAAWFRDGGRMASTAALIPAALLAAVVGGLAVWFGSFGRMSALLILLWRWGSPWP